MLSPEHRLPLDHLFYILWPRRKYNERTRWGLYSAVNTIRQKLGRRELLVKSHDFYQLENVWTDLGELENLIRLADAAQDPEEKQQYLSKAREIASGELLAEFPYDRHIDEYRMYYARLVRKLSSNK